MLHSGITTSRRRKLVLWSLYWFFRIPDVSWFGAQRSWVRKALCLYMTPHEVSEDVLARLGPKGLARFESARPDSLHPIHNSLGRSIRNAYGFWEVQNPWTLLDGEDLGIRDGVITDIRFPDNLSYRIVRNVFSEVHHKAVKRQVDARNTLPTRD